MKEVSAHIEDCLAAVDELPPIEVSLTDSVGCVVARDVVSEVDVPPADLAARDGYAVLADDVYGASKDKPSRLPVTDDITAGQDHASALTPRTAIRLSSGAPVPRGTEAVVSIDDTDLGRAEVAIAASVTPGQNIRRRAEDLEAGLPALEEGKRIGPRQVALLAAAGLGSVTVHPAPRVVIMSIGDELIEPGRTGSPACVYDANAYGLSAAAEDAGAVVFRLPAVPDEKSQLREAITDQLVRADLIVTTGGLSYGGGDTLKEVLADIGNVRFDRVAIAPGRQYGWGTLPISKDPEEAAEHPDVPIFCLPGNPAAAFVGFELFVRPALRKMCGYQHVLRRRLRARAARGWNCRHELAEAVPVRLVGNPSDGYRFEPAGEPGHELLFGLSRANALAIAPAGAAKVAVGDWLECVVLD